MLLQTDVMVVELVIPNVHKDVLIYRLNQLLLIRQIAYIVVIVWKYAHLTQLKKSKTGYLDNRQLKAY